MKEGVPLGWVWSDELADTLKRSPETAELVPASWSARPAAFAADSNEDVVTTGRRLLGLVANSNAVPLDSFTPCTCQGTLSESQHAATTSSEQVGG